MSSCHSNGSHGRLDAAYRATAYAVETPGGPQILRIGARHPALDAALEKAGFTQWAFVTAFNPQSHPLTDIENGKRQETLLQTLDSQGWIWWPGESRADAGDWPSEPSVLILGISLEATLRLGRMFDQKAIVAGLIGEPAQLYYVGDTRYSVAHHGR